MSDFISLEAMREALARYHGARAMLWQYSPSLRRIAIRLYQPNDSMKNLFFIGVGCRFISGPLDWENNHVEIAEWEAAIGVRVLRDPTVGFELRCNGGFFDETPPTFDLDERSSESR